jgi:hypothetical protein
MPNRIIREGFLDSESVNALSPPAECLFHRLLIAADDAGRMDGRAEMVRARLFPLDSSRRAKDVEQQLAECEGQQLLFRYSCGDKFVIQVTKWQRSSPSMTSKYPDRYGCFRISWVTLDTRDGAKEFVESSIVTPNGIGKGNGCHAEGMPKGLDPPACGSTDTETYSKTDTKTIPAGFARFWAAWPKSDRKAAPDQCLSRWKSKNLEPIADEILRALEKLKTSEQWRKNEGQYIPAPLVWLNQKRWEAVSGENVQTPKSVTRMTVIGET